MTPIVKGFKDYSGEEARKRKQIRDIIVETFEKYGFEPAETPIIEYKKFVEGENSDDEAVRQAFKLKDRGDRKLALRYEFTFQLKRLTKNKKLPYKRYQIGEVFRDEPIREGRTRQFTQYDADVVGSTIKDEAENFSILGEIFNKLGIKIEIRVNNRKLLNEIFEENNIKEKYKKGVFRAIDKLDRMPEKKVFNELKKFRAEKILSIFKKPEKYFEKYEAYKDIKKLKEFCKLFNVKTKFVPFLARGFSYYNGMVFEVWNKKLGVSICGGGSYLINSIQSTGISLGLEPIMVFSKNFKDEREKYLVISLNQDREAIKLAQKLRKKGKITGVYYGKPSKGLEYANSYDIGKVIFVGGKEVKIKKFKVKDMKSGKEKSISP